MNLRLVRLLCFFLSFSLHAQSELILPPKSKGKIPFESIANLMIIPIAIEGVEMKFLVDTGVGRTLIFDTHKAKQLGFDHDRPVFLRGLGDQPALEAYHVHFNRMHIGDFYLKNIDALVLPENEFILSKRVGTHIDGIIGYELFAHFPVMVDYANRMLHINPKKKLARWASKKLNVLPLHFRQFKPYVSLPLPAKASQTKGMYLLDTGLSDALWLFSNEIEIEKAPPVFDDFLGTGINGDVFGLRGKVSAFDFGAVRLNQVKVAYPADHTFEDLTLQDQRVGSIGAELMSRFKLIIDYPNNRMLLRSTKKTADPFYYNLSGIELAYEGVRLVRQRMPSVQRRGATGNKGIEILLQDRYQLSFHPALTITYVRPNSPAHKAGLKARDVLLEINGRKTHLLTLEKVLLLLQKAPGEKIRLVINRQDHHRRFHFRLTSIFSN